MSSKVNKGLLLASWALALIMSVVAAVTIALTLSSRYERDVARIVFNRNLELLYAYLDQAQDASFALRAQLASTAEAINDAPLAAETPYLVISVTDRQLQLRQGEAVLFEAAVAIGKGAVTLAGKTRRFDTPRGKREVIAKEIDPTWVAPHWHYQEQSQRRGVKLVTMNRADSVPLSDGGFVEVQGSNVVRISADGAVSVFAQGKDVVVDGKIIVPPFGTRQRAFPGELGTRRLQLGDGYAIHGTDKDASIGTAASHGCVRMHNSDIEALYELVPLHTPVFIY